MREYQISFYELSLPLHSFHFALAVERALTKSKPLRVRQLEIALRQQIRQSRPRSPQGGMQPQHQHGGATVGKRVVMQDAHGYQSCRTIKSVMFATLESLYP
jgi:hypothetical protein